MTDERELTSHVGSLLGTLAVALAAGALLDSFVGTLRAAAVVLPLAAVAGAIDARALLKRIRPARPAPAAEPHEAPRTEPLPEPVRAVS